MSVDPRRTLPRIAALGLLSLLVVLAAPSLPHAQQESRPHYSEGLHGVDLSGLTGEQRTLALKVLNSSDCECGCGMTVAQCRVEDQNCPRSPILAYGSTSPAVPASSRAVSMRP